MSLSLTLACIWIVAAAITAMLPMRWQYAPGLSLLIASLPLMVFVGVEHGVLPPLLFALAVISMFRRPLGFFSRRVLARIRREE